MGSGNSTFNIQTVAPTEPLPRNWKACRSPTGELFYFNFGNGCSSWDQPRFDHAEGKILTTIRPAAGATVRCPRQHQSQRNAASPFPSRKDSTARKRPCSAPVARTTSARSASMQHLVVRPASAAARLQSSWGGTASSYVPRTASDLGGWRQRYGHDSLRTEWASKFLAETLLAHQSACDKIPAHRHEFLPRCPPRCWENRRTSLHSEYLVRKCAPTSDG